MRGYWLFLAGAMVSAGAIFDTRIPTYFAGLFLMFAAISD